jgi:hypothetical protein
MSEYRLLIDADVIGYLRTLKRKEQDRVLARRREIAGFPGRFSDNVEFDARGRRIDVHIFDRHAIKFWDDFADRHLKILDIHPADRSSGS